jgi:hypothetical protein
MCNLHLPARYPSIPPPPSLRLKREKQRNKSKEDKRGLFLAYRETIPLSFSSMVELGSPVLETTQEHMQNLVSQEYITTAELTTYHVSVDLALPTPGAGYVMACSAFYE